MIGMCLLALFMGANASALDKIPDPNPKPGSYGLEATKRQAPPKRGATITTPGNGASFSSTPTTVNGICPNGLLVEVLNNGVMVGSVMCKNGSFSLKVSLFPGTNELSALVYDELNQVGPKSNTVKVKFNDTHFDEFGESLTLTSSYGRRSAALGNQLDWPLQLSGGSGPYAFSVDWGDGSKPELKSQTLTGVVAIAHSYKKAGIYQVNVIATDVKGVSAFLQVVGVSSGKVDGQLASQNGADDAKDNGGAQTKIDWMPTVTSIALLFPSYWLGRRSQVVSLRKKMLKERDGYKEK